MSAEVRLVAEEFANNLDTGEHWNALVEGFMAGAAWARPPMTMAEAIEIGKTDNEGNWDNPVRLMAYRIRTGLQPASPTPNGSQVSTEPVAKLIEEAAKMVESFSPIRAAFTTEDEGGIKWHHPAEQMAIYNPAALAATIRALAPALQSDFASAPPIPSKGGV